LKPSFVPQAAPFTDRFAHFFGGKFESAFGAQFDEASGKRIAPGKCAELFLKRRIFQNASPESLKIFP
jgi:hypothetical protein